MDAATAARTQRGLALSKLLLWSFLIVIGSIVGMKIIPVYIENKTIQHALDEIAHRPEMQAAQLTEVQEAFDKFTQVDNITAVRSSDLIIDQTPAGLVLSVKYQYKVPLVANVSLLFDFNTSSTRAR